MKRERWEQLTQHVNCHVLYEADVLELLFEVRRLSERYEPEPGFCEHGIREGDWCEDCNKAYKEAVREAEY